MNRGYLSSVIWRCASCFGGNGVHGAIKIYFLLTNKQILKIRADFLISLKEKSKLDLNCFTL